MQEESLCEHNTTSRIDLNCTVNKNSLELGKILKVIYVTSVSERMVVHSMLE